MTGKEIEKRNKRLIDGINEASRSIVRAQLDQDVESLQDIRGRAVGLIEYIRAHPDYYKSLALAPALSAAEIKVKAERAIGALDAEQNPRGRPAGKDTRGVTLEVAPTTRAKWRKLGQIDDATFAAAIDKLRNAENPEITTAAVLREATGKAHVANNSGENEWYTPAPYIDAARAAMGGIDLDPASNEEANAVVKAKRIFTIEDNGLEQDWKGRVWLNPPYAQPLIGEFANKLCREFGAGNLKQACVLVNNATETAWFQAMAKDAGSLCFPSGRIKFWHPDRDSATPLQGQAVLYLGPDAKAFKREFSDFGLVVRR